MPNMTNRWRARSFIAVQAFEVCPPTASGRSPDAQRDSRVAPFHVCPFQHQLPGREQCRGNLPAEGSRGLAGGRKAAWSSHAPSDAVRHGTAPVLASRFDRLSALKRLTRLAQPAENLA